MLLSAFSCFRSMLIWPIGQPLGDVAISCICLGFIDASISADFLLALVFFSSDHCNESTLSGGTAGQARWLVQLDHCYRNPFCSPAIGEVADRVI